MKSLLDFDDAGASDTEPVKGVSMGDIRAWFDEIERLTAAKRRFADLADAHAKELADAQVYATRLLVSFVEEHFPPNPDWKPLPELIGVLTQLDNAMVIAREYKAKLAAIDKKGT